MPAGIALAEPRTLAELAELYGGTVRGDAGRRLVQRVVAADDEEGVRDARALTFVAKGRYVDAALAGSAAILCTPTLAARLPTERSWVHEHCSFALAALLDAPESRPFAGAGPSACFVASGARVADDAQLAPGVVVAATARIESGARIEPNSVIYDNVHIGRDASIGACSVIGRPGFGWVTGPGGVVRRMPQRAGVEIGDGAEVGACCTIDAGTLRATRIGAGARIDAHVHVGHNAVVGPGCFVAAQAGLAGSAQLEAGVRVGGQAGFADHVRVGAGASVGAKAGVIGDVPAGSVVAGFPAVARSRWLRAVAKLLGSRRDQRT